MADHEDLPFEKVTNRSYLQGLQRFREQAIEVGTARSRMWVDERPVNGAALSRSGCLAGRVALDIDDPDLGREFYVGIRYLNSTYFSHSVVSWDSPVAKIFYDPEGSDHELRDNVRVRRTMLSYGKEIVRLDDEWEDAEENGGRPFSARRLEVAQPPSPRDRPSSRRLHPRQGSAKQPAPPSSPAPTQTTGKSSEDGDSQTSHPRPRPPSPNVRKADDALRQGMRSAGSVEHALAAPRERALTSVLATLQPDQYRLVTRAADSPLIVQGHPGTGKTIIAIHRAAFLVSSEREKPIERLLFLGPSNTWAMHVSKAVRSLAEREVNIVGIPTFLEDAIALPSTLQGNMDYTVDEVDAGLFELARAVIRVIGTTEGWDTGKDARAVNMSSVYSAIRYGCTISKIPVGVPHEFRGLARSLPSFAEAQSTRRLQPFLAAIAVTLYGSLRNYDHIIVDEAQDVAPLTWEVIKAHTSGSSTIVGDMNQRRNDVGHSSWRGLGRQLKLSEDAPIEPDVIDRGYRSTQPILNFAKALLPSAQRDVQSLQTEGAKPTVKRANSAQQRNAIVEEEAARLSATYPRGQVAVIVLKDDLEALEKFMLRSGWRKQPHHFWHKGDLRTKVVTPATARGVEFDGVVVVEPGDFPRNLGRVGQLYTSLTRANRELSVVHHKPLPDELRRHERRR